MNNELYHYGVKGMSWKNHKYKAIKNGEYIYDLPGNNSLELRKDEGYGSKEISIKSQYGKGKWDFNRVGIERVKNKNTNEIAFYNTANTKYFDDGERVTEKRVGPIRVSYAEDGVRYSIQFNKVHRKHVPAGKQFIEKSLHKKANKISAKKAPNLQNAYKSPVKIKKR